MAARRIGLALPTNLPDRSALSAVQKALQIEFADSDLLRLALTHKSFVNEYPDAGVESNERLEFLGDGVVNFVVARNLYRRMPEAPEGELTNRRSHAVRREALASAAERIGLGSHLVMGRGEAATGGAQRPTNLANAFEALSGAVFLDRGFDECEKLLLGWLGPEIDQALQLRSPKDPKSLLQEIVQRSGISPPTYRLADCGEQDYRNRFAAEALIDGEVMGTGVGGRKIDAERAAAQDALNNHAIAAVSRQADT